MAKLDEFLSVDTTEKVNDPDQAVQDFLNKYSENNDRIKLKTLVNDLNTIAESGCSCQDLQSTHSAVMCDAQESMSLLERMNMDFNLTTNSNTKVENNTVQLNSVTFDKDENFENDNKILVFEKVFLKTNANIQSEFTLKVSTNGIIVNGSDLIKFAHYLKTNKVSIKKDSTVTNEVIYLVYLNVDLCTSEDIYRICTWMNMKSFISEKTAKETILKYFEYKNRRKKVDPLSQIMKDYNGLEIAVKNIMDKMILIFYKFLNPQSYKKGIMHVDPNEVIKELYENIKNSEEMQKSYADTIFNTYVNLPELEIVTEILPESIRNFYETSKEHFKRMLMLTAVNSLETELKKKRRREV